MTNPPEVRREKGAEEAMNSPCPKSPDKRHFWTHYGRTVLVMHECLACGTYIVSEFTQKKQVTP